MSLPITVNVSVTCGHCGSDLHAEDWTWQCHNCLVYWEDAEGRVFDLEDQDAEFQDDSLEPCGAEPSAREQALFAGFDQDPGPCALPTGHTSSHYHPVRR